MQHFFMIFLKKPRGRVTSARAATISGGKMKKLRTKLVTLLATAALLFAACGSAFAATPNDQVIAALSGAGVPGDLVGIAENFLKADPATTLTQAQADAIVGNISAAREAAAAVKDQGNAAMLNAVSGYFTAACNEAGFSGAVGDIVNGSVTFTVTAPGKSVSFTVSAASGGGVVVGGGSVSERGSAATTVTGVGKTAVDNTAFILAGVLGAATLAAAGFVALRRKAIR